MKIPRISIKLAAAVTVAIGVAAYTTYWPRLNATPNPTRAMAEALCEQSRNCLATTASLRGTADRLRTEQHVTMSFKTPPTKGEIEGVRRQLAATTGKRVGLNLTHTVGVEAQQAQGGEK